MTSADLEAAVSTLQNNHSVAGVSAIAATSYRYNPAVSSDTRLQGPVTGRN